MCNHPQFSFFRIEEKKKRKTNKHTERNSNSNMLSINNEEIK